MNRYFLVLLVSLSSLFVAGQPVTAILGAFPPEVNILHDQLQQKKDTVIQQVRFSQGILNGRRVVLALTGMGKVNAAMTTTLVLEHFAVEQLVFTGIAGGVDPALHPGDLVIGTALAYHDYGTLGPDSLELRPTRNPFTLQDNPLYYRCDSGLVRLAEACSRSVRWQQIQDGAVARTPVVTKGVIVTGDVFVASSSATELFRRRQQAAATEMEGAAVGQVCWQQHVPFLVIRSLSDNANSHAAADVRAFYQVAANNSASLVIALAGALSR